MADQPCPCGAGGSFSACCGRFLEGADRPGTPQDLMRSRYSAFVVRDLGHLVSTHHASTRPVDLAGSLQETFRTTRWIGLRILGWGVDPRDPDRGWVEFAAFHDSGQIHERSRFRRDDGNWSYVDGTHLAALDLDRNAPCVCASGRKWKKCHGAPHA